MTATSIMFISDANDKATLLPLSPSVIIPNTTNEDCCLNNKNSTTSSNEDSAMTSSSSIRSSKENNNTTAINNTTIVSTSMTTKMIPTSHSPSHLPSLSPSPLLLLSSSSCGYHDHYHDPSVTDESLIILKNNIDRRRKKFSGWQRGGCGGSVETFPFKLHEMLKQPAFEDMVAWQTHGRCFMIHQVDQFVNDVLPRFFNQSKFRSFQRQLNMYGFRRLRRGVDRGGYYHELFLQGREDLCRRLIRSRSGAAGAAKKGPNGTSASLSTSSSSSVASSSSNGSGSDHNSNNHCSKESSSLLLSSSCAASIAKASAMEPNFYAMESCGSSSTTTNKGKTKKNIPELFKSTMMGEQQQQQHWQQHQQQQYHHHQRQGQHQQLHQQQMQRQQQQKRLQQNFSDVNDSNNAEEDSSLWSANSVENNIVRKNTTLVPLISTKRKRSSLWSANSVENNIVRENTTLVPLISTKRKRSESFNEGTKNGSHFEGEGLYLQALSSNFHYVDSARQQQRHLEKGSSRTIAPISNITTSLTEKEGTRPFLPPQSKVEISTTTTALIEREERETSSASLSLLVLPQIESCLTLPTTEDNSNEGYGYSSSKLNTFFAKEGNNEIAFLADELPLTDSIFDEEEIILPMANVTPPHSSSPPPVWECSDTMLALPYPFNEIYNTSEVLLLPST